MHGNSCRRKSQQGKVRINGLCRNKMFLQCRGSLCLPSEEYRSAAAQLLPGSEAVPKGSEQNCCPGGHCCPTPTPPPTTANSIPAGRGDGESKASVLLSINQPDLRCRNNAFPLYVFAKHSSNANHLQLQYNALITNVKKMEHKINFSLFSRFREMRLHATRIRCPRYENSPL